MNFEHCCRIPKYGHISETLMDLHWLPVQQHDLFKILILTYQAYHKTAPDYSGDLIIPYSYSCNLRSNNQLHDYMYTGYTHQFYIGTVSIVPLLFNVQRLS